MSDADPPVLGCRKVMVPAEHVVQALPDPHPAVSRVGEEPKG